MVPTTGTCGFLGQLPNDVLALVWVFCGPRRLCVVRPAASCAARLSHPDQTALRRSLCRWALSAIDMAALRPVKVNPDDAAVIHAEGLWCPHKRRKDFAVLKDGAGRSFVRGPALLRCTQRWRLRAREKQLGEGAESLAELPLPEALRTSAAAVEDAAVAFGDRTSVHAAAAIWDEFEAPPPKRARRGHALPDSGSGLFAVRRWDAIMDPKVPWRLRMAAVVYHHHGAGCQHHGIRKAAARFISRQTLHDEKLRAALLDAIEG